MFVQTDRYYKKAIGWKHHQFYSYICLKNSFSYYKLCENITVVMKTVLKTTSHSLLCFEKGQMPAYHVFSAKTMP